MATFLFFLRTKEPQDFGPQEANEGFGEHFSRFLRCIVEEVLWVSQHVKQCLHELLVLRGEKKKCVIQKNSLQYVIFTHKKPQ